MSYDRQAYTSVSSGNNVVIDDKRMGLLRISGTFTGTVDLKVQKGNDLENDLASGDWVTVASYTEPTVQVIESPARLRWKTECSAYTSGEAVAELNGG